MNLIGFRKYSAVRPCKMTSAQLISTNYGAIRQSQAGAGVQESTPAGVGSFKQDPERIRSQVFCTKQDQKLEWPKNIWY